MDEQIPKRDASKPIIHDEITIEDFIHQLKSIALVKIRLAQMIVGAIRRNWVVILFLVGISTALLFLYQQLQPPTFKASITVSYNKLAKKIYGDALGKLQHLVENKEFSSLAPTLGISEEQASKIVSIDSRDMRNHPLTDHLRQDQEPFSIILTTKERTRTDSIAYLLIEYLAGNPYIDEAFRIDKKRLAEEEQFLSKELQLLDSLRILYNENLRKNLSQTSGDLPFLLRESINPVSFYDKYQEHFKRLQDVKSAIESYEAFKIIDIPIVTRTNPPDAVPKLLFKGILAGMVLSLVVVPFREIRTS